MRVVLLLGCFSVALARQCDVSSRLERVDCIPESVSTQPACEIRGCCWEAPDNAESKIPSCFYPIDYDGYAIVNQTETSSGLRAYLKRSNPSRIDTDIEDLLLEVIVQSDYIVRIRITDPNNRRWEPPLPKVPPPRYSSAPTYNFAITNERRLEVHRLDQNKKLSVRLVSFNLATLVYTDRFIQITNDLPSDIIYGLGGRKGKLKRSMNFTTLSNYNQDRAPTLGKRLYGTHPIYVNVESDGRANGMWFFNSNGLDMVLQPSPAITYRTIGGVLDFFAFTGPTPADVVKQYQEIVGRPKMIPYWSLGFHLCRWGYKNTSEVKAVYQRNIDAGIRLDVQWTDIDYMDKFNDFTVDPKNFAKLNKFVDDLHASGRHFVLILDPAVSGSERPRTYPPYIRGMDYNVFMKDADGKYFLGKVWNLVSSIFPDFTHPNATAYWSEMMFILHRKVAFDGAWIDMNEPSNFGDGHDGCKKDAKLVYTPGNDSLISQTLCTSDQHYWSSHYNVHNMYGFTEAVATYNALASLLQNKRPFIISRSTFSGQGNYSNHWTGDVFSSWADIRDSVSGFLEYSLYGLPLVGVDICGFNGNTTVDLCARWQAVGAFYPFSRNHNTIGAIDQDPAALGEKVLTVTRNAYYWRYKLLPFMYTLIYEAHVSGETVTRPLFFENPEDPNTHDNDEQFLWGKALMVVPALYENQETINAYFPKGIWYDLQNRTQIIDASAGGKQVNITAYEDIVNFFMKGGHCVFFQEPGNTTTESRKNPYGLYVFLDENLRAHGTLFSDDGESIDSIDKGAYDLIYTHATAKGIRIAAVFTFAASSINPINEIHVYGIKSTPKKVVLDGSISTNFAFDANRQLLSIYIPLHTLQRLDIDFYYE